MQDRYAGDIGDYGKIALLKSLQAQGLSVGVNWYRVEELESEERKDGSFKQNDGDYLIPEKYWDCDETLAKQLIDIANLGEERSIEKLERANFISGAIYYSDPATVAGREEWHKRALKKLEDADIVFLDPDNGLKVKSVGEKSRKSVKYVLYDEIEDYIRQGQSVLIYNHRSRKPEEKYFQEIYCRLRGVEGVADKKSLKITFPRYSVRDYIAIAFSEEHYNLIRKAFISMTQGIWGQKGMCFINPMGDDIKDIFEFQKTYPTKEAREAALKHMTDEQIKKLVTTCGTQQGKAYYASFLKG